MARAIFISYRRDDTEGEAGRLFDDLVRTYGDSSMVETPPAPTPKAAPASVPAISPTSETVPASTPAVAAPTRHASPLAGTWINPETTG